MLADDAELLPLSAVLGSAIVDRAGEKLGRTNDVIVRLGDGGYPPVTGLRAAIGGRHVFIPVGGLADVRPGHVKLSAETLSLQRFERRPGEVLLREDVQGRKLIDVEAGRLVRAHDVVLGRVDQRWRVVGVSTKPRRRFRRLIPGAGFTPLDRGSVLDWSDVEPFVGHVPTARLLLPLRRLKRLHPAQIADLVQAVNHDQGEEIITAVHGDPELEADVFEELDPEHQVEFLRTRSNEAVAAVLAGMGADDAADLITEVEQERRQAILALLPPSQLAKVRGLLAYHPGTAGGLMSPDYLAVESGTSVAAALDRVRQASLSIATLATLFVVDGEGRLTGSVSLASLIRAASADVVEGLLEATPPRVRVHDDLADVALFMTDFNVTAAPVVGADGRLVGVVTVDDLLEAILPEEWRRRAEAAGTE